MNTIKVRDLMAPFSQCPKVSEDATLRDAVLSLEATRLKDDPWEYRPRVILVYDKNEKIVGTLRHFEVLKALEPKYKHVVESLEPSYRDALKTLDPEYDEVSDKKVLFRMGLNSGLVNSIMENYHLWNEPLRELAKKAAVLRVRDIMSFPEEGEIIDQGASINRAIHQLLMGNYLSLVVRGPDGFQGILRLSDVFNEACSAVKLSEL